MGIFISALGRGRFFFFFFFGFVSLLCFPHGEGIFMDGVCEEPFYLFITCSKGWLHTSLLDVVG